MSTQLEAFPKTNLEILEGLRAYHVAQLDKARAALANLADHEKIARAYEKAEEKVAAARQLVGEIDAALERERERESVAGIARNMRDTAQAGGYGLSFQVGDEEPIVIAEAPVVDPVTGEVADLSPKEAAEIKVFGELVEEATAVDPVTGELSGTAVLSPEDMEQWAQEVAETPPPAGPQHTKPCPACEGDGRPFAKDGSRNGNAKCRMCAGTGRVPDNRVVPVVVVLYPGDDEPHVTEVGPFTRYSELVADYLATLGPVAEMSTSIDDYQVRGENDGALRDLKMDIPADDHGKRLVVEVAT